MRDHEIEYVVLGLPLLYCVPNCNVFIQFPFFLQKVIITIFLFSQVGLDCILNAAAAKTRIS
jgi:hypothetical protein